jgi:DNA repair photolyase
MSSVEFTRARQIVIERKYIDSWFLSRAHLNIYRGCRHNCVYCDGRYEGYHVPDEFGADIVARENAPQLLDAALNPHRKKRWRASGYLMLGGGVSDSYQPDEKKVELARACLKVVLNRRQPVHILTKSTLVERDLSLIRQIHDSRGAIVSMSFSGVNDEMARIFEPGCPLPSERLNTMSRFVAAGVPTGMFLMPVIPGVTDSAVAIGEAVQRAAEIGACFVVFGGMTLKPGRQKDHFDAAMSRHFPEILEKYPKIYRGDRWGGAVPAYYHRIEHRFTEAARIHRMWRRIPPRLFTNVCDADDRIQVILEQLEYLQKAVADRLPFGTLARSLRKEANAPTLIEPPAYSSAQMAMLREIQENGGDRWYMRYL